MATRMQQRRGTASQWTTANPVLAAGEIGFETDTNQFKIGDGVNVWGDLSYFKNLEDLGGSLDDYLLITQVGSAGYAASLDVNGYIPVEQLGNVIGDAPQILNTLEELAGALQDADGLVQEKINTKAEAERTITDGDIASAVEAEATARDGAITAALAAQTTQIEADYTTAISDAVASEVIARDNAITQATNIEVTNRDNAITEAIDSEVIARDAAITQAISTAAGDLELDATTKANTAESNANTAAQGYVSDHNADTTNVHGISDTSALATKEGTETLKNKTIHSDFNTITIKLANIDDVSASVSELNILDGATLSTTELNYVDGVTSAIQTQLDAKASLAAPALTGNATAENLTISGNLTVNGTTTTVDATNLEVTDSLIYLSAEQYDSDIVDIGIFGAYGDQQAGHVHTGLVRDASDGKWKLISNGSEPVDNVLDFGSVTYDTLKLGGVEFADGIQTQQGVPSITPIGTPTISNNTVAYTVNVYDRDSLIELPAGGTITIPNDSVENFPVGSSFDILQTSPGQVTITPGANVTINATPGLKLRTQWSSATLFKRGDNTWVAFGDLSA